MSLKVTYAESEILNLTASAQKTLTTSGKYCTSDIGIDYTSDSAISPVKDGKTRIYISIPTGCDLSKVTVPLYWNQSAANGVSVDWGDGSPAFTVSGTGNVSAPTPHSYPDFGNYVITMTQVGSTAIKLGGGTDITGILGDARITTTTPRAVLTGIETGDGVNTLAAYCCCRCGGLKTVIFGEDITTLGNYVCAYAWTLSVIRFLGPTLPSNANIGATNPWPEVPNWCKIYVPSAYIDSQGNPQNIPARMPSTSTYTYAEEPST